MTIQKENKKFVPEKFIELLNNDKNWEIKEDIIYYKINPNYRIEINHKNKKEDLIEPYSVFYLDNKFDLCTAEFFYNCTCLEKIDYILCDGYRTTFPTPTFYNLNHEADEKLRGFYYYILNTFEGSLANLLLKHETFESRGFSFPFIIFKNDNEKENFVEYLQTYTQLDEINIENYHPPQLENKYNSNIDLKYLRLYSYIYEYEYTKK